MTTSRTRTPWRTKAESTSVAVVTDHQQVTRPKKKSRSRGAAARTLHSIVKVTKELTPAEDGTLTETPRSKVARNKLALASATKAAARKAERKVQRKERSAAQAEQARAELERLAAAEAERQRTEKLGTEKAERAARERHAAKAEQVRIEHERTAAAKAEQLATKQAEREKRAAAEAEQPRVERPEIVAVGAEPLATNQAEHEKGERKHAVGHKQAGAQTRANGGPRMPAAVWADWLQTSVDRRLEAYRHLMRCTSPSELAKFQRSFASDAIRSWLDASSHMLSHLRSIPREFKNP